MSGMSTYIVMQARGDKHQRLFQVFGRQGAKDILVAQCGAMGGVPKDPHLSGAEKCQQFCQCVAGRSFRGKSSEELKELEALELLGRKHRFEKLKKERERARMLEEK